MSDQPATERKRPFDTYETTIESAERVTPRNVHLKFKLPEGKRMPFKAGQFVQIFIPREGDKPRRTSYSIASPPHQDDRFELCVTLVTGGRSSSFLHSLKTGDQVTAMGPLGKFCMPDPLTRDAVFIATGSGIAPLRSMIHDLLHKKTDKNLYLLFGNRYDDDIIYQSEWEEMAKKHANFRFFFTLSRPTDAWTGPKGYVGEKIGGFVPDPSTKDFFICGLSNMINAVEEKLLSLGVPAEQIHFEKYD